MKTLSPSEPSPPKGRSSLCSRLLKAGQACALASQRQVKPVLSPLKGWSSLFTRLQEVGQVCALASRPRRGRMSITAGVESEANETCGPPECGMIVLEEGEHKGPVSRLAHSFHLWTCMASTHGLLMFALFLLWQATKSSARTDHLLTVKPQVAFASLSPPAVMDIRRLRRRLLEVFSLHARLRFPISLFSHPFSYPSSRRLMDLSNIFLKFIIINY